VLLSALILAEAISFVSDIVIQLSCTSQATQSNLGIALSVEVTFVIFSELISSKAVLTSVADSKLIVLS
jgi:hypothetical protein